MFDDKTLRHLPLDALRTFVAAARLGSFTQAGQEVHRTQSAVSMQMKKLETELDRPLFHRQGRAVSLTGDGTRLLGYARRLLKLHDEALAELAAPALTGVVRLGVPDDYASRYLPGTLRRFQAAFPKVRVDVTCDATGDLLAALDQERLDLCLATGTPEQTPSCDPAPASLGTIPLVWIAAAGLTLDDLWDRSSPLPLAVFHHGCMHRRWALLALEEASIPFRIAVSSLSLAAVLATVRSGLAVSPVTVTSLDATCQPLPRDCGLPQLPPVTASLHRRQAGQHPAADALADFLAENFHSNRPDTFPA